MERAELARKLGAAATTMQAASASACVIAAERAENFMSALASAVREGGAVFLADPAWDASRRLAVEQAVELAVTRGRMGEEDSERGWLMIPSGGTSGALKFARHDQDTIAVAVRGFCAHFGLTRVNAVGLLPMHHVSGFMAWMRCAVTGGTYLPWSWAELKTGMRPEVSAGEWVISLVPTQLQRLLEMPDAVEWLRGFKIIFVGGGPVWPELAEAAARAKLPISLSYGMTETAAMISALRPEEFLAGARSSGTPLPHAQVTITGEGLIRIAGDSLYRGYFPAVRSELEFRTEDLGFLDERGHLHIAGRRDAMIITGGKKVQPAEVEAALRATGLFADVGVIGVPDFEWGEAVVACYPISTSHMISGSTIARALEGSSLLAYQYPKRYVAIAASDWPRNAQGKLNRAALQAWVKRQAETK